MSTTQQAPTTQLQPIDARDRMKFLPRLFGAKLVMIGENSVYTFMGKLCPAYSGGYWEFFEAPAGALYMAPNSPEHFQLSWDGNGFIGEVSKDAAGMIATLFTLSHMSMAFRNAEHLADHYHQLLDFAADHAEAGMIFSAID